MNTKPQRGEIWRVRLDPAVGDEMGKTRPYVVLSNPDVGILDLCVVPITDWKERYNARPWMHTLNPNTQNGLAKISAADGFQVRSISTLRLLEHLGNIDNMELDEIFQAVTVCIEE